MSSFLARYTQAAGMSTARWMLLPAQPVCVYALTPTQNVADDLWAQRYPMPTACADPCIHIVQIGAALWVEDGHHRLARARREHQHSILARVLIAA